MAPPLVYNPTRVDVLKQVESQHSSRLLFRVPHTLRFSRFTPSPALHRWRLSLHLTHVTEQSADPHVDSHEVSGKRLPGLQRARSTSCLNGARLLGEKSTQGHRRPSHVSFTAGSVSVRTLTMPPHFSTRASVKPRLALHFGCTEVERNV